MGEDTPEESTKCRRGVGITFGLLAGFSWALGGLFVKYVQDTGADDIQFIRSSLQYLIILPVLTYHKKTLFFDNRKTNFLLLLRGLAGVLANWMLNFALLLIPLGDVMSIVKTDVALIGLFACICLGERCTVKEVLITLLTFVGLVLVARPTVIFGGQTYHSPTNMLGGVLLACGAAFCASLVGVIVRKLGVAVHFSVSMIHYAWIGVVFSVVLIASKGSARIPCAYDLLMASGAGLVKAVGQIFMTIAYQYEKAGNVAVLQSSQIIFGLILQYAFLGYLPTVTSLIGSLMIFCCTVALTVIRMKS